MKREYYDVALLGSNVFAFGFKGFLPNVGLMAFSVDGATSAGEQVFQ